ncbi:MAG: MFS transporter [Methylocapsa sp.]|nr:MFS transporter [Methylocapsa sp.]
MLSLLTTLTQSQRNALIASYLGWTLDAFDFFILVFVLKDVAADFQTNVTAASIAITLTLAARPVGALAFGLAADRYGRRIILMINISLFSLFEFASGLSPGLVSFLIIRLAFGVAMGGEWGVGAALTMETIPARARGIVSGILQSGYPAGYLLSSLVYAALFGLIGWRGMFMLGALPALLVLYIRRSVEESPAFVAPSARRADAGLANLSHLKVLRAHSNRFAYTVLLMTVFNFLSHGTQDLYPTFLEVQRAFSVHTVGLIAIIYNIGAIFGGLLFGALSQHAGRRVMIVAASLLALPVIPLWAYGSDPVTLAAGAFLMQFAVQGAWGIVPAHLNELSPAGVRGTFPGLVYQLGNLLASANATLQAAIAEAYGGDYAFALAAVTAIAAATLAALACFGSETHGADLGPADDGHAGGLNPP